MRTFEQLLNDIANQFNSPIKGQADREAVEDALKLEMLRRRIYATPEQIRSWTKLIIRRANSQ